MCALNRHALGNCAATHELQRQIVPIQDFVWKLFSFCNYFDRVGKWGFSRLKGNISCKYPLVLHKNERYLCNLYTKQEFSCVFHIWTK